MLLKKVQDTTNFAQAALAATQQRYEETTNKRRIPSERFEVGDKVWLHMGNYRSPRPSKKLDALHRKFTVTKVIGSHVLELDVPTGIYPRFHVDLLRRAAKDPLPGQKQVDFQPPPIQVDGEDEWEVQEILCARTKKRGRGSVREALVRWTGYADPTWEPIESLSDVEALERYIVRYGPIETADGPLKKYASQRRQRRVNAAEGTGTV